MRIASYFPNDPILDLFTKTSKHDYIENGDDKCEIILCMSITQHRRTPRGTQLPLICHVWDVPSNWRRWCRNESDYAKNVHRDAEISNQLHLLWEADLVIACSSATQRTLKTMGIKSEVLHNFYYGEEIDRVLEGYERKPKNRIIQVSRYALNKRFDLTARMWAKVQQKHPDWELVTVGPYGPLYDELKGMAVKGMTVEGEMDRTKLLKLMADSKILVAPSLHEGYGLTPIEARHMGLEVVCAKAPWVDEFGYATKEFEPDNLEDYIEAVEGAIDRPFETPQKWNDMTPEKYAERFDKLIDGWWRKHTLG